MAKSKYTFEKRERERAKRQKQIAKSAQRMMAKKGKTGVGTETVEGDTAQAEPAANFQPPAEGDVDTGRT